MNRPAEVLPLALDDRGAEFSSCRTWRYALWRIWDEARPTVTWVMLNPSTADEQADDPTIRRCLGFTRAWGAGSAVIVNLFGLRATDPRELYDHPDPVGPGNDEAILRHATACDRIVLAWGNHGSLRGRAAEVFAWLEPAATRAGGIPVEALAVTGAGEPGHPLYLPRDAQPMWYRRPS